MHRPGRGDLLPCRVRARGSEPRSGATRCSRVHGAAAEMSPSSESQAVRDANRAFYEAFESLDAQRMEAVWVHSARAQCTHPGWRRLVGFSAVIASWRRIFENTFGMK